MSFRDLEASLDVLVARIRLRHNPLLDQQGSPLTISPREVLSPTTGVASPLLHLSSPNANLTLPNMMGLDTSPTFGMAASSASTPDDGLAPSDGNEVVEFPNRPPDLSSYQVISSKAFVRCVRDVCYGIAFGSCMSPLGNEAYAREFGWPVADLIGYSPPEKIGVRFGASGASIEVRPDALRHWSLAPFCCEQRNASILVCTVAP